MDERGVVEDSSDRDTQQGRIPSVPESPEADEARAEHEERRRGVLRKVMGRPGLVERLDAAQRRHPALGFPIAVLYKFVDDQGVYLASLITHYAFLSVFPLLLLATTILGFILQGHPHLQQDVVNSALGQFPVIGQQLKDATHPLVGSGAALAVGIIGSVYGGLGMA